MCPPVTNPHSHVVNNLDLGMSCIGVNISPFEKDSYSYFFNFGLSN